MNAKVQPDGVENSSRSDISCYCVHEVALSNRDEFCSYDLMYHELPRYLSILSWVNDLPTLGTLRPERGLPALGLVLDEHVVGGDFSPAVWA